MPTVLLVEDDAPLRVLTESILDDLGFAPISAAGPEEALEIVGEGCCDILFTDLNMGGDERAGLQLAQAVRAIKPDIPVVYTTGGGLTAEDQALFVRPAAVLPKPYTLEDLTRVLQRALGSAAGMVGGASFSASAD